MTEHQKSDPIDKDMTILDVVRSYPETKDVFVEAGLDCVGCMLSPFETLEEGTTGHGWPREDLNQLIATLNDAVRENLPE